jgi:hypothetical protein
MATYSTSPLYNSLSVSIVINDTTNKYFFPDIPQLRSSKLQAIEITPALAGWVDADYNNVPLVSYSNFRGAYVTLYSGNKEAVQNLPALKLFNIANQTQVNVDGLFALDNIIVDFSKSYITFAQGTFTGASFPQSVLFNIFYTK